MTRGYLATAAALLLCLGCQDPSSQQVRTTPFSTFADTSPEAQRVSADSAITLPADHASHPGFRLEWWYLTATLEDNTGAPYGVQFTLFRIKGPPEQSDWSNGQQWLGHVSVHSTDNHYFAEKLARGGVGNAGVSASPFAAYIDDWQWRAHPEAMPGEPFPSTLALTLSDAARLNLTLRASGPAVLHGDNGYSQKSADGRFRSYYYSQPFIEVSGSLTVASKATALSGEGWFDHEWTSQLARKSALGWDWLSLTLEDGRKLMAFNMYVDGSAPYTTATLIATDGQAQTLTADDITLSPAGYEDINDKSLPVEWQVRIPSAEIALRVSPFKAGQWNPGVVAYYEGRVEATGSHQGTGFLELTGY